MNTDGDGGQLVTDSVGEGTRRSKRAKVPARAEERTPAVVEGTSSKARSPTKRSTRAPARAVPKAADQPEPERLPRNFCELAGYVLNKRSRTRSTIDIIKALCELVLALALLGSLVAIIIVVTGAADAGIASLGFLRWLLAVPVLGIPAWLGARRIRAARRRRQASKRRQHQQTGGQPQDDAGG